MAKKASKRNYRISEVQLHNASGHTPESQLTTNTLLGRLMARIDALENQQEAAVTSDFSATQSVASVPQKQKASEQSEQGVRSAIVRLMGSTDTFEKLVQSVYEKFAPVLDFSVGPADPVGGTSGARPVGGCPLSCAINETVNRIDDTIRKLQELMNAARLD